MSNCLNKKPICHSDESYYAKDLCHKCYQKIYDAKYYKKNGRKIRVRVSKRHRYLYYTDKNYRKENLSRGKELRKDRRKFLNKLKNVRCVDCNIKYPPYVMEFDHIRGNKLFTISNYIGISIQRLKKEIKKCEIVCSNCHRIRTQNNRKKKRIKKSKQVTYIKKKKDCPCLDCNIKYPTCVMDFDHVRGKKSFQIGCRLSMSFLNIKKEIKKCDIVCSNCHRIRTWKRKLNK